jgi:hypothetical protein
MDYWKYLGNWGPHLLLCRTLVSPAKYVTCSLQHVKSICDVHAEMPTATTLSATAVVIVCSIPKEAEVARTECPRYSINFVIAANRNAWDYNNKYYLLEWRNKSISSC